MRYVYYLFIPSVCSSSDPKLGTNDCYRRCVFFFLIKTGSVFSETVRFKVRSTCQFKISL